MGFLVVWAIMALVGYLIGKSKSRPVSGFIWGLLLGPIGWLVIAVGPDMGPKCPACKGDVVKGATKCKNCGSDL